MTDAGGTPKNISSWCGTNNNPCDYETCGDEACDVCKLQRDLAANQAQLATVTIERDAAIKEIGELGMHIGKLQAQLAAARAGLREWQSLEKINREREKNGLPIIYNPTVCEKALAVERG